MNHEILNYILNIDDTLELSYIKNCIEQRIEDIENGDDENE